MGICGEERITKRKHIRERRVRSEGAAGKVKYESGGLWYGEKGKAISVRKRYERVK